MKTKLAFLVFVLVCVSAQAWSIPTRYARPVAKPVPVKISPAPLFTAAVVPVSIALYITKAEFITTMKKKADNAALHAGIAALSVGPGFGWGGAIAERGYGKEEAYLDAMDYASFLRN